uniref:Uncharacterized protein n=1 Tax=Strigamia maritima TaxID=126957 RepID=T1J0C9_STRMM
MERDYRDLLDRIAHGEYEIRQNNHQDKNVKSFLMSQGRMDEDTMFEKAEHLAILNKKEILRKEIEGSKRHVQELRKEVAGLADDVNDLQSLHQREDMLLRSIFGGEYGSSEENHLEEKLDAMDAQKQQIEAANFKWRQAEVMVEFAVKQMGAAVDRWTHLIRLPLSEMENRFGLAEETRNNLIAATQNIQGAQRYLPNIKFPYCNQQEVEIISQATSYVFTDMQSPERQLHALEVYTVTWRRSAALLQWFDFVLDFTILKDLAAISEKVKTTAVALRRERIQLIRIKLQENGRHIEMDTDITIDSDSEESDFLLNEMPESMRYQRNEISSARASRDFRLPSPLSREELAPPPTREQLFGIEKIDMIKSAHVKRVELTDIDRNLDKTRVEMDLQAKLRQRRQRRARHNLESAAVNDPHQSRPFIPQLPRSYMAKMEVTDIRTNTTKYAVEYYDGENMRGALTWRLQGEETRVIYDGLARTLITVVGWTPNDPYETSAQCIVSKFSYNQDNFIIGVQMKDYTTSYLALIGGLLRYNSDLHFKYNNWTVSYVRGMKADMWEACLYLPEVDGTFDVVFYWSDLSSTIPTPSGEKSVPLKTKISGTFWPNPDNEAVNETVLIVTNFLWFQSNPPLNEELFQPPRGVFCQNDEKYKPFPPFPNIFSVFTETQVQIEGKPEVTLTNQKLWYNLPAKLQRMDDYGSDSDLSTIIDYNSGVAYFIDEYSTNCSVTEQIYSKISLAEDIFMMNVDKLEYLGKYTIRDRLCDSWSGKSDNVVIEWSFLDDSWHQSDGDGSLTRTPVQTVIINHKPTGAEKTTRNYFHFHPNDDELSFFEVDYCFGPDKRKVFQISFQVTLPDVSTFSFTTFARNCRIVLAREMRVTLLRVSQVKAEYNQQKIYIQFTLLDKTTPATANNVELSAAVTILQSAVTSNSLLVTAGRIPNSQEILYLTALPDSLLELDNADPCSQKDTTSGKRLKRSAPNNNQPQSNLDLWSTGLGIGLFAIGSVLGVIVMLILLLRLKPKINTNVLDDGIQLTPTTSTKE